jgi:hypothetical protein
MLDGNAIDAGAKIGSEIIPSLVCDNRNGNIGTFVVYFDSGAGNYRVALFSNDSSDGAGIGLRYRDCREQSKYKYSRKHHLRDIGSALSKISLKK